MDLTYTDLPDGTRTIDFVGRLDVNGTGQIGLRFALARLGDVIPVCRSLDEALRIVQRAALTGRLSVPLYSPLLVATTNPGKTREIVALLTGLPIDIITLAEVAGVMPPDETGETFEENARAKALYYAAATGQLTVAEDSGLEIDALGGAPGIHSARFGGAETPYARRFAMIYDALRAKGAATSPARFVCALALARPDTVVFEARGTVEGEIAAEPRGDGGFGYDPIFFYPPFGQTLAEAGERKSAVSHRARAFSALRAFLTQPT